MLKRSFSEEEIYDGWMECGSIDFGEDGNVNVFFWSLYPEGRERFRLFRTLVTNHSPEFLWTDDFTLNTQDFSFPEISEALAEEEATTLNVPCPKGKKEMRIPYKRKRAISPAARDVEESTWKLHQQRVGILFKRYFDHYSEVMSNEALRFTGVTAFVFAIMMQLNAEELPVTCEQIYAKGEELRQMLSAGLREKLYDSSYKPGLRNVLYSCQLFVPDSSEPKKRWTLRGREVDPLTQ